MLSPAVRRPALVLSAAVGLLAAAAAPAQPLAAAPAASAAAQRIEITGGKASDSDQRRQSSAAKIVIGREEIERFGDSNTLEVLKRLPGITIPGPPGRGGAPRMRGMAGGYTQILIDGERMTPGLSLDAIPPEQIERIEILRAPTAETGARAIAGTINIVLREGYRRKQNDLNLSTQVEGGEISPSLAWTRNETLGAWIVNGSLSLYRSVQTNRNASHRVDSDIESGQPVLVRDGTFDGDHRRRGFHAGARLQWRDEQGTSLMLQPLLLGNEGRNIGRGTLTQPFGSEPIEFSASRSVTDSRFLLGRLNANLNQRIGGGWRLEWRAGVGRSRWASEMQRREFDAGGALLRTADERTEIRDRNATLSLKAVSLLGAGHQAVGGAELERHRRSEDKTILWDGVPQLTEFGEVLAASSRRWALYAQDEWSITPRWAVHAGLRVESIAIESDDAGTAQARNTSRVTTPLLHTVWKFDDNKRDQLRASLTRSYRAPNLNQLVARPSLSRVDPAPGPNTELSADSAGNPALKPEVALGVELALERYLADGGVLSVNLFQRRIEDLIRNVVSLQDVSWSPGQPRFVSRPTNIGDARTRGIELEAKFRLDQLVEAAPPTELRANASVFRSTVEAVPGPDNRLAEQPGGTLNLGADHRFRGTPLTLGGNVNHTPGYRTRLDVDRWIVQSEKTVLDAYALWTFSPELRLRLSLSNLSAPDSVTSTEVMSGTLLQDNRSANRSFVNTQLRLEIKL
jgi:outer membrane receptor for ferrienterochelin and colicins